MKKRILRTLVALLCLTALLMADFIPFTAVQEASAVTQAEIDALKNEKNSLASQKSELEKELKALQSEKASALDQKTNIDRQIGVLQSQINLAEKQISQYEQMISQTEQEIRENEEKEAEQYQLFCERVRAMEERGTVSYWSVLFHSASFSDLLGAMDFVNAIMESDQRVIDELRETRAQIEEKKASLETALAEQEEVKAALVDKNHELKEQQAAAEKILRDLQQDEAEYKKLVAAKEAAMEAQQAEIARLSRELAAQNQTPTTYGGYIWPCASHYVTSPLGSRYTGIPGASTSHAGIDIGRVYYSTQVVASKAGTVIISDYNKYRGNYVVVSHGSGNTTTYQHLSKRSVSVGQNVTQGQVVGITGSTGVSSGPHLHFEIMENGKIIDPLKYLTDYVKGWR